MFSFRKFYPNDPIALSRHLEGRFVKERELFLNHCVEIGVVNSTLEKTAPVLLKAAYYLDISSKDKFCKIDLYAAVDSFMKKEFGDRLEPRTTRAYHYRVLKKWCVFLGKFDSIEIDDTPWFASVVGEFEDFLIEKCELAPNTIRNYTRFAGYFFVWLSIQRSSLDGLTVVDVDNYFCNNTQRWHRRSMKTMSNGIRILFRYLEKRKLCRPGIADAIRSPMVYSQEDIPRGPSWENVRKFIESENPNPKAEARDKAIVLILAIYGFRASELATLSLDAVDWKNEIIMITRSKTRRSQVYPLTPEVGDAILEYLRKSRPKTTYRELFHTLAPPYKPLFPASFANITSRRFKRAGIELAHYGTHSLRHACASNLINKGLTLKEVGDHLGHKSIESTSIYAKINLEGLREVAKFDLGGLI